MNTRLAEAVVEAYDAIPAAGSAMFEGPATMRIAQEWMVANAPTDHDHRRQPRLLDRHSKRARGVSSSRRDNPYDVLAQRAPTSCASTAGRCDFEGRATVAETARSWRLEYLGRFADYCAAVFGELPCETLRGGSPGHAG